MRDVLLSAVCSLSMIAACGSGGGPGTIDAPPGTIDSPPGTIDAPPGGNPDAPAGGVTCASYCADITTNCTGIYLQYASAATCMASCAAFPVGTAGDQTGNSLACRSYHAGSMAQNMPAIHCVHAGPDGGTICGTRCNSFCSLVQGVCTGANQVYASPAACSAACAGYALDPAYTANVVTGNSLACRTYHGTAASTSPGAHCPHTAAISAQCN